MKTGVFFEAAGRCELTEAVANGTYYNNRRGCVEPQLQLWNGLTKTLYVPDKRVRDDDPVKAGDLVAVPAVGGRVLSARGGKTIRAARFRLIAPGPR